MKTIIFFYFLLLPVLLVAQSKSEPYVVVLGVAQDGGYPHTGCLKHCCAAAWDNDSLKRFVVSLAVVDPVESKWWLFEATPDFKQQLQYFHKLTGGKYNYLPAGIFVTHAHMGHYTGLMHLGKEVMSTRYEPVYCMPKMAAFLQSNGPWSQLVNYNNILIRQLVADSPVTLSPSISVVPFIVPHRDEYSETAGFKIVTSVKKYLFIPDINKFELWNRDIIEQVKAVDVALIDATFYDYNDLPNLHHTSVPHPIVVETMEKFGPCDAATRSKIHFIHFNHTNPMLWDESVRAEVHKKGFNYAVQGETL